MIFPFLSFSAVVPALLLVWFFHSRDLHREPASVVWATFGLGVAVLVPECTVAALLHTLTTPITEPIASGFASALLVAAIPEEAFKLLVLVLYCMRHRQFDEPMDGIVYGAVAGLGFACLENVVYVLQGSIQMAIVRALTAVPNHACLGAIMGYYVGQAKFAPSGRAALLVRAFAVPVAFHTLYDFPLLAVGALVRGGATGATNHLLLPLVALAAVVMIVEWVTTWRLVRRMRREQEEVLARFRAFWLEQGIVPAPGAYPKPTPMIGESPVRVRRQPITLATWLRLAVGFVLASVGGIVVFGVVTVATGTPTGRPHSLTELASVGFVLGVLPLSVGLALFVRALRRVRGEPVLATSD